MNKKPSFLARLTGVLEEEENNSQIAVQDEPEEEPEEEEEEKPAPAPAKPEIPVAQETEKKAATPKKVKKINLQEEEKTEWLPDSEGQLTIDVYQTPADIVIKSTIAGVSPEDLDITITNDMVTIKGHREKDEVISEGDYYYQECYWGGFSRSIILPVDVEAERAEAGMKNGILTIRLPKVEKIKTRKIKVSG